MRLAAIQLSCLLLLACGLRSVVVTPDGGDLFLNDRKVSHQELLRSVAVGDTITVRKEGYEELRYVLRNGDPRDLRLTLTPLSYTLDLTIIPEDAACLIDGKPAAQTSPLVLTYGTHVLVFQKPGLQTLVRQLSITGDTTLLVKLLAEGSRHEFVHQVNTGIWPKSIIPSPDGRYLFVPLLKDTGIDVIDMSDFSTRRINIPGHERDMWFVEGAFNLTADRILVTQMSTAQIHVISYPDLRVLQSVPTGGTWSKVIALSPGGDLIAVSNWMSNDVSILDAHTYALQRLLRFEATTPRGLAFTPDGSSLYVAYFDSGDIVKVSTRSWLAERTFHTGGNDRDVVIEPEGRRAFVSNMSQNLVYVLDVAENRIVKAIRVGVQPNSIRLTPDGQFLYVSCRGPNNPVNYELPSPENGTIHVIDTRLLETVEVIPGGNQPTGVAISPDGRYLAFTNFQDHNVEIYAIRSAEEDWAGRHAFLTRTQAHPYTP